MKMNMNAMDSEIYCLECRNKFPWSKQLASKES